MYSISLEVNQKCNLRCKYCYLGDKAGSVMSLKTAKQSVDLAFDQAVIHRDKKIWFDFIGGEALIDFPLLNQILQYIQDKNKDKQYHVKLSMTSNATLLNSEIIDWLAENNFDLKVSIDGKKDVHDLNRVTIHNRGSFDAILKNWKHVREYERKAGKYIQATNVITRNNYMHYGETVKFLVEELGIKIVDTAIDLSVDWKKDELTVICDEINKVFSFYEQCAAERKAFGWSFINEVFSSVEKKRKFYSCGAGIISLYVRTDGTFYPCHAYMVEEESLGNADQGLNRNKIEYLKNLNSIDNENCNRCEIYEVCGAKGCIMQSLETNGDVNLPDPTLCYMQKFKSSFYYKNIDRLKKIAEGSRAYEYEL
ncbi:MAG: SPASM domain-containing protein [Paenibacillus macerans]|uniref:Radical SAM additional 4Fe4S-binding SPASM domain protein n=1 Tax=Paenibacillus macerans TaxID=44252 RepID=A0A090Y7D5_PAEMA|nr:SPASM domain-containing protein [Paenibacillus macerans]KFM94668.1 radical SAM additional 4Fe4S-binding SPASM domain protein [Paenibacillus macerans]MBS5909595.1 SPASM domain-containing protein [Paenibacillus macerans]MCY7557259.1 SPASM domain-containing protein [Paenibacillus macerans]MDU7471816.1 SPASM domain-containing protein [Paenibacillus macerans]MEC0136837.1 SPASM domain-containing protein [Paenibacillus macerans]